MKDERCTKRRGTKRRGLPLPRRGENKAARLPGWRSHHKLYLAAVALVAVCVWLIVWLVVFGKVLPDDIVGLPQSQLPSHC